MGNKSHRLTAPTSISIPIAVRKMVITSKKVAGSISSMHPISLENRFKIRPDKLNEIIS